MFKSREEILKTLKKENFEVNQIAKGVFSVLSEPVTLKRSSELIDYAINTLEDSVLNLETSKEVLELAKHTTKDCAERLIVQEKMAIAIKYRCMFADVLSVFRKNKKCMEFVVSCYTWALKKIKENYYLSNDLPPYFEIIARENLGLIYSDEDCVYYDLHEAFVNFEMLDAMANAKKYNKHLSNTDYMYGYAKSLLAHGMYYNKAFELLKRATEKGHQKSQKEFQDMCRRGKRCTSCGGEFKGFFTKKCISCGKKKDY